MPLPTASPGLKKCLAAGRSEQCRCSSCRLPRRIAGTKLTGRRPRPFSNSPGSGAALPAVTPTAGFPKRFRGGRKHPVAGDDARACGSTPTRQGSGRASAVLHAEVDLVRGAGGVVARRHGPVQGRVRNTAATTITGLLRRHRVSDRHYTAQWNGPAQSSRTSAGGAIQFSMEVVEHRGVLCSR